MINVYGLKIAQLLLVQYQFIKPWKEADNNVRFFARLLSTYTSPKAQVCPKSATCGAILSVGHYTT